VNIDEIFFWMVEETVSKIFERFNKGNKKIFLCEILTVKSSKMKFRRFFSSEKAPNKEFAKSLIAENSGSHFVKARNFLDFSNFFIFPP